MALFRLFDLTGERRYLATARFFIDQRGDAGRKQRYGTYSQDHRPFVEQENGVGHSVRAGYLYCAATDIARRERDEAYANALFRVWDNVTNRKMYLTGGIGQPGGPEGFAGDYELGKWLLCRNLFWDCIRHVESPASLDDRRKQICRSH